jgi:predicted nucleic acid-binding protein
MGASSPEKKNDIHLLRKENLLIEFRDIFIAATCLVNHLPIKTINKKHFERIKGLEII